MSGLLESVNTPQDLKKLPLEKLEQLAEEVRTLIKETVLHRGGHLASNLGLVEATIALHYVFDFEEDMLIFDVSHQCYTHKILTGRRQKFCETLRCKGGISGFTNPAESRYDAFVAGHAGTALSWALGVGVADSLVGRDRWVVAVVGDGALGTGMTLEALNHAAELKARVLILLNDNRMSIPPTVGAFARYLDRIRAGALYRGAVRRLRTFAQRLPAIARDAERFAERAFRLMRRLVLPPGALFEELGLTYFGPLDGHNIPLLVEMLRRIRKQQDGCVILHIVTQKGRGHQPAEDDPERYHGASPQVAPDGKVRTQTITAAPTYTYAFSRALQRFMETHKDVVAVTAAMPTGTGLDVIRENFPERFFDVGICEQHAVGLVAGMSRGGLFPVVAIYSTFMQRAFDQLFHDIALQKLPCILALDRAGIVGRDGPTHHGTYDIAYTRILPTLTVAAPKCGSEFLSFFNCAYQNRLTLVLRYPRDKIPDQQLRLQVETLQPGKAEILKEGEILALVGYGATVKICLDAAEILARNGHSPTVVNLRWVRPLDKVLLKNLVTEHQFVVVVEDHTICGGVGSAILEALSGTKEAACVKIVALPDKFVEHGSRAELLSDCGITKERVAQVCSELLR